MNRKTVIRLANLVLIAMIMAVPMLLVPEAVQPVEASSNQDNIRCGRTVYGQITTNGYYDNWYFDGNAGDKVTIRMKRTSGNLETMVRLWFYVSGPGDQLLEWAGTAGGSGDAVISNFSLPKKGTYRINARRIGGEEGTTTGSYWLTLDCNTGSSSGSESSNSNSSGGISSNSCPQYGGGSTAWEGEIGASTNDKVETLNGDLWVFEAEYGDRVQIDLSTWNPDPPYLGLYQHVSGSWVQIAVGARLNYPTPTPDPSGPTITFALAPTYSIQKTLTKSGCYYVYIVAASHSQQNKFDYTLEFSSK